MEPTDIPQPPPTKQPPPHDEGDGHRRPQFSSKRGLAWVTAIGTLLAGVAAVVGLWSREALPPDGTGTGTGSPSAASAASIATVTSFGELADVVQVEATAGLSARESAYEGYTSISTDQRTISAPDVWTDRPVAQWIDENREVVGNYASASDDFDRLYSELGQPGIWLGTSAGALDPAEVSKFTEEMKVANCRGGDDRDFAGEGFLGTFRIWTDCGERNGTDSITIDFVARDTRSQTVTVLFFRLTDLRDLTAFRTAMTSFARVDSTSTLAAQPSPQRAQDPSSTPGPSAGVPAAPPSPRPSSSGGPPDFDQREVAPSSGPVKGD